MASKVRTLMALIFLVLVISMMVWGKAQAQEPTINEQIRALEEEIEVVKNTPDDLNTAAPIFVEVSREQRLKELEERILKLEERLCISCVIIAKYADLTNKYVKELSNAVLPGMIIMFASLVGLWVVLQGYKLLAGIVQPQQLYVEFMYVAIGFLLLNHVGADFVDDVYHATLSIIGSASEIAFVLAEKPDLKNVGFDVGVDIKLAQYESLLQLVYTVEQAIRKVMNLAGNILASEGLLKILYAIILILPYFLVGVVYFSQLVVSVFRLMMLAAFSPFLMMAYAFGWGRGMATSAIRTLISSIAIMFAVTASVALVVYAVDSTNLQLLATQKVDLANTRLILLIILGWMSTAFMTEATAIANSITGSALSNTAAGVLTAGATATAAGMWAQRRGLVNPLTWGSRYHGFSKKVGESGEGFSSLVSDARNPRNLYDKFKHVSRGGKV